jgi:hypothetical protein
MITESITEPIVTKRDIIRLTVNIIPVDFLIEEINTIILG